MLQCTLGCPLDQRTISHWVAERNAELDDISAAIDRGQHDLQRGGKIRIATGDISNETRGFRKTNRAHMLRFSRRMPMSLSPRPETFTITTSDFFILGARLIHSATACADSSAGITPSVRESVVKASNASWSDTAVYSARLESKSAACSGPSMG